MALADLLLGGLRAQRRHVVAALDGLTEAQLTTPVPPMTWAPLAVPHHLALDVERWWFQCVVANDPAARAYVDANPNGAWKVPAGIDVLELYAAECATSDDIIRGADFDALPPAWPDFLGPPWTVGQVFVHVIGETGAHAGQLDVVRELIDGHQHLVLD